LAGALLLQILVDNGEAPLTLQSLQPAFFDVRAAADFTLTVDGAGFTAGSVVRWNGSDRPTVFVSSSRLAAAIYAADVSLVGDFPVTVRDPQPAPGGSESALRLFRVVPAVYEIVAPLVRK